MCDFFGCLWKQAPEPWSFTLSHDSVCQEEVASNSRVAVILPDHYDWKDVIILWDGRRCTPFVTCKNIGYLNILRFRGSLKSQLVTELQLHHRLDGKSIVRQFCFEATPDENIVA